VNARRVLSQPKFVHRRQSASVSKTFQANGFRSALPDTRRSAAMKTTCAHLESASDRFSARRHNGALGRERARRSYRNSFVHVAEGGLERRPTVELVAADIVAEAESRTCPRTCRCSVSASGTTLSDQRSSRWSPIGVPVTASTICVGNGPPGIALIQPTLEDIVLRVDTTTAVSAGSYFTVGSLDGNP
jgi:hypothetical protein